MKYEDRLTAEDRDPDGARLPIRIDTTSNGEFSPVALEPHNIEGNIIAHSRATENARRKGESRRSFMMSACGAATTLLAVNEANARAAKTAAHFNLSPDAALDADAAMEALGGEEFIFDVQGHYVNPTGAWLGKLPESARPYSGMPNACVAAADSEGREYLNCLGPEEFIKDVFLDSDTDMMVLSFVPSKRDAEPVTIEEADATRRIVDAMEGDHRLMLHGRVNPNQPGDLEDMARLAADFPISAWKTYTQWGPDGNGFFMTDDAGEAMIENARKLGVNNIAIHKGLSFGPKSYEHSTCADIGEAAKRHPDINFILYHSGLDLAVTEEEFTPGAPKEAGIDVLCQSLIDAGVGPNKNVYAELGSTWRILMRDMDQAAHAMGKLVKYCGEDNVLWGTDSIWYGSPQDQIQAFRAFEISAEHQERYGYAPMTRALKAKIFGLNAMVPYKISLDEAKKRASSDALSARKHAYLERPNPSFTTYGPKTRREFLNFKSLGG
ncbi:amidohydrolase family protein [Hyphococcus sp.]|uniref:amidohydrolase family protein n=1 Tax=Hyphococcus sp. TaxID=2038636 RepID=UPI003CCBE169